MVKKIHADVVRQGDLFRYNLGEVEEHIPWAYRTDCNRPPESGEIIAAYCFVQMADGVTKSEAFFNPSQPDANLLPSLANDIERWVEHYAGDITIYWSGYAERVGYPIPRPGKMQIGDEVLVPAGKGRFLQTFVGNYFCRPVYRAFWKIPYKCKKRLAKIDATESVPAAIETPAEEEA